MLEGELEEAIRRAFPLLLPDLYHEGYRIKSSQAILLGRRIDLLLETADRRTCIIELKAGAPPMPHVRDQIHDYAECWRKRYPVRKSPRLIVISDVIPKVTESELAKSGVESRAISVGSVRDALERCRSDDSAATGLKLDPNDPDDLARVRDLLSDYDTVAVPDDVVFGPPWNHEKVYAALVKRGEGYKDLWKKNPYVRLFGQYPRFGVLYHNTKANAYKRGPLHFNPRVPAWNEKIFQQIKPSIEYVQSDNKGPGRERYNCDWYRVKDWDRFAVALGL